MLQSRVGLIEVFTGKAPLSAEFERRAGQKSIRIGLEYGQDLEKIQDRRNLLLLIARRRPEHVWVSFPCKCWGPWSRFNQSRSPELENPLRTILRNISHVHLHVGFYRKHLEGNATWKIRSALMPGGEVWTCRLDQCMLGLKCPASNEPVLKPTPLSRRKKPCPTCWGTFAAITVIDMHTLKEVSKARIYTEYLKTYPRKFVQTVVKGMLKAC